MYQSPDDQAKSLILVFFYLCIACYMAKRKGFFKLSQSLPCLPSNLSAFHVIAAFFLYFGSMGFSFQILFSLFRYFSCYQKDSLNNNGWIEVIAIFLSSVCLTAYVLTLSSSLKVGILGNTQAKELRNNLLLGVKTWLIAFPSALVMGLLMSILLTVLGYQPNFEQEAVKYLKSAFDVPLLCVFKIVEIIALIPFIEELLFRGFLQSWLREKMGSKLAIILTSMIFAIFHFSIKQGFGGNIQLLASLFVLSCFLGFLYEKQRGLAAPFSLHATFNSVSTLLIIREYLTKSY